MLDNNTVTAKTVNDFKTKLEKDGLYHCHAPLSLRAQNNWRHRLQALLTYLQSPGYQPTFISA